MACPVQWGGHMARSIPTQFAVAASLLLGACGPQHEGLPLVAFAGHSLSAGIHAHIMDRGGVDPGNYSVTLGLAIPPWEDDPSQSECPAISMEVVAKLDGRVMKSYAETSGIGFGGCNTPLFSILLPVDQFGPDGGNGRFVISDASHTMNVEFADFYALHPVGQLNPLPVVSCEGVRDCWANGAQPL
jgi:hypothetical protein